MKNNIVKIYYPILLLLFSLQIIHAQSKRIESLTSFSSIFQQKIVRISDKFKEKFVVKKEFLQLFYYNVNKDIIWTSNQRPNNVSTLILGTDYWDEPLELLDDGFHFDNNLVDGIYANYHFGNRDELRTDEINFEICCYEDTVYMDSIGIGYAVLLLSVSTIPEVPQIISPQHNNVLLSKRPTIRWSVGNDTDNCGIILLDEACEFGEIFQHILWEKEIETKEKQVLEEIIPFELSHGNEYSLIIWSSNNHYLSGPEDSQQGAYSMDYIIFKVDTTVADKSFQVFQNYPNPFNNWTAITWIQEKENITTINIYNILGEQIKTLLSNKVNAGKNNTVWDGTDGMGRKVSTGIYFLTIRTQNQVKTIKMVYNK